MNENQLTPEQTLHARLDRETAVKSETPKSVLRKELEDRINPSPFAAACVARELTAREILVNRASLLMRRADALNKEAHELLQLAEFAPEALPRPAARALVSLVQFVNENQQLW